MRSFFAASCLVASAALADLPNGVWTGYVNGWVPNSNAPVMGPAGPCGPSIGSSPVRRQPWVQQVPYYVMVQAQGQAQQASAEKAEAAVRAAQLEAERQAAVDREQLIQRQLDAERQLAAQRELAAQQQLEAERQLAAQRLALAQQQQVLAVAAVTPPAPPVHAAPKEDAKPYQPGNDVYRWVDDDGVTHYSTTVPDSARARAKKVGGASP
jgi:hypothetical protein